MATVTPDIGESPALALAEIEGYAVTRLGNAVTIKSAEHASLRTASERFAQRLGCFRGGLASEGRFERMLSALRVKNITRAQHDLFGAVIAFAKEHCR